MIQGVSAQGKRVTRVIPAGKEGNEKEIDIVTETWYSPDLQVVVMSKTSDPRFGEYRVSVERDQPGGARSGAVRGAFRLHGERRPRDEARRGPARPAAG